MFIGLKKGKLLGLYEWAESNFLRINTVHKKCSGYSGLRCS